MPGRKTVAGRPGRLQEGVAPPPSAKPAPSEMSSGSREYLRHLYLDATSTIRHYDTLRATFTQIFGALLTIFGSLAGAQALHAQMVAWVLPAAATLTLLSVLALAGVLKFNDLIALQRRRASLAMRRYEVEVGDVDLSGINKDAKEAGKGAMARVGLGQIWVAILVVLLGANASILVAALLERF